VGFLEWIAGTTVEGAAVDDVLIAVLQRIAVILLKIKCRNYVWCGVCSFVFQYACIGDTRIRIQLFVSDVEYDVMKSQILVAIFTIHEVTTKSHPLLPSHPSSNPGFVPRNLKLESNSYPYHTGIHTLYPTAKPRPGNLLINLLTCTPSPRTSSHKHHALHLSFSVQIRKSGPGCRSLATSGMVTMLRYQFSARSVGVFECICERDSISRARL
jgi:hypothetical protein